MSPNGTAAPYVEVCMVLRVGWRADVRCGVGCVTRTGARSFPSGT